MKKRIKNKSILNGIIIACVVNLLFLCSLFVCLAYGFNGVAFSIFITMLMIVYHTDVRIFIGVSLFLGLRKKMNIDNPCFKVGEKEFNRLNKLKVKKWKDKFVAWDRKQFVIRNGDNFQDNISLVLKNNINAEIIHWLCFFIGFFAIWIGCAISIDEWWIYLITSFVASFVCDLPPILIQRYNRFRLQKLRKK